MIKVKICGIKNLEEARIAIQTGADMIGFNFVRSSKRRIDVDYAKEIISKCRSNNKLKTKFVGIFQNQTFEYVNMVSECLDLDFIQLHGDECPTYVVLMKRPVIKALSLYTDFNLATVTNKMKKYGVAYFLLDRQIQGKGEMLNKEKVKEICKIFPTILSGGLTPENIRDFINHASPTGVDVASGIETNGRIDYKKMKEFIKNSHSVDESKSLMI